MPSDLTIPQRVTLLTESGQSNQMVRVFPAINRRILFFLSFLFLSLSFLFFLLFFLEGGGKPGKKLKLLFYAPIAITPSLLLRQKRI